MPFLHFGLEPYSGHILYGIMIIVFIMSIFWRPIAGLMLMIVMIPIHTVRMRMIALPLGSYFFDILLLGVFIGLIVRGQFRLPKGILGKVLIGYMVFTYLSLLQGAFTLHAPLPIEFHDPRFSYWHGIMLLPLLFYAAYGCVQNRIHILLILACMSIGILGVTKSFRKNAVEGRDFSSFSYSIRAGGSAAMGYVGINGLAAMQAQWGVFFGVLLLAERKKLRKAIYLVLAGACGFCVLYALSRGAYSSVLAAWVYLGTYRKKFLLLIPLVLFAITWEGIVPGAVRDRVLNTVEENGELEGSAAKRLDLWNYTMEMVKNSNPLIGDGFYTFSYFRAGEELKDTHNLYLKILVETGVIGVLLFLSVWFLMYRQASRVYKLAKDPWIKAIGLGFCASMVCIVVGNFFGDRWFYMQMTGYTFVMMGVINRLYAVTMAGETTFDEPIANWQPVYPVAPRSRVAPAGATVRGGFPA